MVSDQTKPDQSICYLLQLPRELRDAIYTYALTEPQHLHFRQDGEIGHLYLKNPVWVIIKKSHGIKKRVRVPCEANQLRYVNRQLYEETNRLSLNLNDIVFETIADALIFFNGCSSSYLQGRRAFRITTTPFTETLFPRSKYPPSAYRILRFCEKHPNITIWALTELLTQTNGSFVTNAIYWQARFRKAEDFVLLKVFATDPVKYHTMAQWGAMQPTGLNVPINFRPVPPDGPFDESIFLKTSFRGWPYTEGDMEPWLRAIRDIYANGI